MKHIRFFILTISLFIVALATAQTRGVANNAIPGDNVLRFYRLAIAIAPNSYTTDFGSNYENVNKFWQECEDFMNEVYVPLGMCFDVVIDQRLILGTDLPVNNGLPDINGVTALINNAIGSGSYDVGLCISYRGKEKENTGLSIVNGAYDSTTKANGYAMADKWVVAHEAGHLFGADHTPAGEGSLMDQIGDYFSYLSIKRIRTACMEKNAAYYSDEQRTQLVGANAGGNYVYGVKVDNSAPSFDVAQMKDTYEIPQGSCLAVELSATDADGDALRYMAIGADIKAFASLPPQESNVIDYHPRYSADIFYPEYFYSVQGTDIPELESGESYGITLVVHDCPEDCSLEAMKTQPFYCNYAVWDATVEIVGGTAFEASISPADDSYSAGESVTVEWGVNNSVFTEDSRVRITMSADYGETFPYVLAESIPATSRSCTVTLPDVNVGNVDVDFVTATRSMRGGIIRVEEIGGAAYTLTTLSPKNGGGFTVTGGSDAPDPVVPKTYTVSVLAEPAEGGTATVEGKATVTVDAGSTVTLTATPYSEDYKFDGWYLNDVQVSTSLTYTPTVTGKATYIAKFSAVATPEPDPTPKTYTINATAGAGGSVTINGEAVSQKSVNENSTVTLVATPQTGYIFVNWTSGTSSVVSTDETYSFTATGNTSLVANFEAEAQEPVQPEFDGEQFPDGAYKIYWKADNRGYLAYHATDYPSEAKLAGVTYSGCQDIHYAVDQVDLVWYLITADDGKRYLFQAATGMFLGANPSIDENGIANKLSTTEAWPIAIEENTKHTGHYIITTEINGTKKLLCSGCGTPKEQHPVRWLTVDDTNQTDGGAPLQLIPVNDVTVAGNVMNAVLAVINGTDEPEEPTDPLAGKYFRLKDNGTGKYMNVADNNTHTEGTYGGVSVATLNESSNAQIFFFEANDDGYKLKDKNGYYINCQAWNVDANSTTSGAVLTFEPTANELEYLIKWDNTNMNHGVERDDYFKAENGYVYCDAASNAAATWVLEEVVYYTVTATAGEGGSVSPSTSTVVEKGKSVTLTATPDADYSFVNWTKDGVEVSTDAEYTFDVKDNGEYVANFKKEGAVEPEPTGGYYYIINRDVNRHEYLYNNAFHTSNSSCITLQSDAAVSTNNGVWYITFNDNNTLGIKNGDGKPVVAGASEAASILGRYTELTIGQTIEADGYTYYYFTNGLNCSKSDQKHFKIEGVNFVTTWSAGGANALDNQWRLEPIDMQGMSVYKVEINSEDVYVTYNNEYAYNGGFFITNETIDVNKLEIVGNEKAEIVVEDNIIRVFPKYTITVNAENGGTASSTATTVTHGDKVTLTATVPDGYTFDGWYGSDGKLVDESKSNPYTFEVTGNINYTAKFVKTYAISVKSNDPGGLVFINKTGTTSGNYAENTTIKLSAVEDYKNSGYIFTGWYKEGSDTPVTEKNWEITVTEDAEYEARFVRGCVITASPSHSMYGGVNIFDENDVFMSTGRSVVNKGETVKLSCWESYGFRFLNYTSGDKVISEAIYTLENVQGDMDFVANFEPVSYTLTVSSSPLGAGKVEATIDDKSYGTEIIVGHNMEAKIIATPASGYKFVSWTKGTEVVSESATYTIPGIENVEDMVNVEYVANFVKDEAEGILKDGAVYQILNTNYTSRGIYDNGTDNAQTSDLKSVGQNSMWIISKKNDENCYSLKNYKTNRYLKGTTDQSGKWTMSSDEITVYIYKIADNQYYISAVELSDITEQSMSCAHNPYDHSNLVTWNNVDDQGNIIKPSVWNFSLLDLEEISYTVTDELGNEYSGTYMGVAGVNEPTFTGAYNYKLENGKWNGSKYAADIKFPMRVSKEGGTTNELLIEIYETNQTTDKYLRAVGSDVKVQAVDADLDCLWAIYPLFNATEGKFTFVIKNVLTGKYIYSSEDDNSSKLNTKGTVVLNNKATEFEYNESSFKFAEKAQLYLSINSDADENVYLGVHNSIHNGTKIKFNELTSYGVTIGDAGYATFYAEKAVSIPEGVEAYYLTKEGVKDEYVSMTKLDNGVIPAKVAVVLKGEKGTYILDFNDDTSTSIKDNLLEGTAIAECIEGDAYVLAIKNGVIGLYLAEKNKQEGTAFLNNGHKIYLPQAKVSGTASLSAGFRFILPGATAVEEITTENAAVETIYDLQGRKLTEIASPGIYIINGKKVFVK